MRLPSAAAKLIFLLLLSTTGLAIEVGEFELQRSGPAGFQGRLELIDIGAAEIKDISVKIADDAYFSNLGIERSAYLDILDIAIVRLGTQTYINVSSDQSINKKYLIVLLEIIWPGSAMLKEFAVLLKQSEPGSAVEADSSNGSQEFVLTRRNETLWRIATKTRPSERVSVNQHMLAIYELNPNAFIEGNMNLVKTDFKLRIPSELDALQIKSSEAVNKINEQSTQYREMLNRSEQTVQLPAKAPMRGGEVRIFSEGSSQVEDDKSESGWAVRGPELLIEKELLDQRIKELTQKFSEERLYANQRLSEKDAQIDSLETEVNELLEKLGRAQAELKRSVGVLGSFTEWVKGFVGGAASLTTYIVAGLVLVGLIVLGIRKSSLRNDESIEDLSIDEFDSESNATLESTQKPSEPTVSVSKPEDYEKELEEESYTITTKINLAKANIEINKIEAAKDILKEVIDEGDESERDQASDILDSLNSKETNKT